MLHEIIGGLLSNAGVHNEIEYWSKYSSGVATSASALDHMSNALGRIGFYGHPRDAFNAWARSLGSGGVVDNLIGYFSNTTLAALPLGLTFYKDFTNTSTPDADFSVGSKTATFTWSTTDSTRTYIDSNGIIQIADTVNTPRYAGGYYDSTGFHTEDTNGNSVAGLMIEGAGTNYVLNSYFSIDTNSDGLADNWTSSYGTKTLETCSINGITGGKSQKNVHVYAGDEGDYSLMLKTVTPDDSFNASAGNISACLSFWARGDLSGITTGATTTRWLVVEEENNAGNWQRSPLSRTLSQAVEDGLSSTTWTRISFALSITDTDTRKLSVKFVALTNADKPGEGETGWIEVYGVQVEKSPYATSFIPTTTAAVTRNAEVLKYAISGNRTAAQETISIGFVPLGGSFANDGVSRILTGTETKNRQLSKATTQTKLEFAPNGTDSGSAYARDTTTTNAVNTSYFVAGIANATTGNPNSSIAIDGTITVTDNNDWTSPVWGTNFSIGTSSAGNNPINGIIKKVAIFNRALGSAEISSITTQLE